MLLLGRYTVAYKGTSPEFGRFFPGFFQVFWPEWCKNRSKFNLDIRLFYGDKMNHSLIESQSFQSPVVGQASASPEYSRTPQSVNGYSPFDSMSSSSKGSEVGGIAGALKVQESTGKLKVNAELISSFFKKATDLIRDLLQLKS